MEEGFQGFHRHGSMWIFKDFLMKKVETPYTKKQIHKLHIQGEFIVCEAENVEKCIFIGKLVGTIYYSGGLRVSFWETLACVK